MSQIRDRHISQTIWLDHRLLASRLYRSGWLCEVISVDTAMAFACFHKRVGYWITHFCDHGCDDHRPYCELLSMAFAGSSSSLNRCATTPMGRYAAGFRLARIRLFSTKPFSILRILRQHPDRLALGLRGESRYWSIIFPGPGHGLGNDRSLSRALYSVPRRAGEVLHSHKPDSWLSRDNRN